MLKIQSLVITENKKEDLHCHEHDDCGDGYYCDGHTLGKCHPLEDPNNPETSYSCCTDRNEDGSLELQCQAKNKTCKGDKPGICKKIEQHTPTNADLEVILKLESEGLITITCQDSSQCADGTTCVKADNYNTGNCINDKYRE